MKGQISTVCRLRVGKRMAGVAAFFGLVGIVSFSAVTQEQNEIEEAPLTGVTNSTQNPLQIALVQRQLDNDLRGGEQSPRRGL